MSVDATPQSIVDKARILFAASFQHKPTVHAVVPGRVNLIGDHVDYNAGIVLPFAIERFTAVAVARNNRLASRVASDLEDGIIELGPDYLTAESPHGWTRYMSGTIREMTARFAAVPSVDVAIASNLPVGAGLSSSAALCGAIAIALAKLIGAPPELIPLAMLCQVVEHTDAGVRCGIMDQIAVLGARQNCLLQIDCRDLSVEHVPMADPRIGLMVIDSGVTHELAASEYGLRRSQCESAVQKLGVSSLRECTLEDLESQQHQLTDVELRRAVHVVTEIRRTELAVQACRTSNWVGLGRLLAASHESLRDLYQVSCQELDLLVSLAGGLDGVYGCRMTGGGFGGSVIAVVDLDLAPAIEATIKTEYHKQTGIATNIFLTRPAAGGIDLSDHVF